MGCHSVSNFHHPHHTVFIRNAFTWTSIGWKIQAVSVHFEFSKFFNVMISQYFAISKEKSTSLKHDDWYLPCGTPTVVPREKALYSGKINSAHPSEEALRLVDSVVLTKLRIQKICQNNLNQVNYVIEGCAYVYMYLWFLLLLYYFSILFWLLF